LRARLPRLATSTHSQAALVARAGIGPQHTCRPYRNPPLRFQHRPADDVFSARSVRSHGADAEFTLDRVSYFRVGPRQVAVKNRVGRGGRSCALEAEEGHGAKYLHRRKPFMGKAVGRCGVERVCGYHIARNWPTLAVPLYLRYCGGKGAKAAAPAHGKKKKPLLRIPGPLCVIHSSLQGKTWLPGQASHAGNSTALFLRTLLNRYAALLDRAVERRPGVPASSPSREIGYGASLSNTFAILADKLISISRRSVRPTTNRVP